MAIKLNKREKYSIYAAVCVICLFVILQFVVSPFLSKKDRLQRTVQAKTKTLENILAVKSEYDLVRKKAESMGSWFNKREKNFTLFSFLDELAGKAEIKDHISYMKPSTTIQKNSHYNISMVEMKLQGITLNQLILYVHMVETSKNMVQIKRLSISKTKKQEGFINTVLQVETIVT